MKKSVSPAAKKSVAKKAPAKKPAKPVAKPAAKKAAAKPAAKKPATPAAKAPAKAAAKKGVKAAKAPSKLAKPVVKPVVKKAAKPAAKAPAKVAAPAKTPAKAAAVNPFLRDTWMPAYDAMTPEACTAALEQLLPLAKRRYDNVIKQMDISWQGLMIAPDEAVHALMQVWGDVWHLTSVVNSEQWRAVKERFMPKMIEFGQLMSQNKPLFEAMLSLQAQGGLKPWQSHVLARTIETMTLAGVGLSDGPQKQYKRIEQELAKIADTFNNHVLDADKAAKVTVGLDETAGIPADLLQGKGPWELGIDFATYDVIMRKAESSDLRERFWRARATRASSGKLNNAPLIEKILKLRQQEATLLGFADYAHLSTKTKMAGTPQAVIDLLSPMLKVGKPAAKEEQKQLLKFARAHGFRGKEIKIWDKAFWVEQASQALFGFDEEALRDYFPMERVITGLFDLITKLFGVSFQQETGNIHAWHKDVRFYKVLDAKKACIAGFYFDPYARPGTKNGGAWMNGLRARNFENGKQNLPIATVCCNQKAPQKNAPATMSVYEISTLFHEMGHALQEMLTRMDSPTCAGINNVEWDAVEIASQFLEQFANEPKILKSLSCHIKTGKPLPNDILEALHAKRTYRAGNALVRQLQFAFTDLALHAKDYPKKYKNANACKEAFAVKCSGEKPNAEERFLNAFTHIFCGGYSAGYFSYKWSETLSADLYGAFLGKTDAQRKALGKKYRETFLALGGSKPAAEVFQEMMGRGPDVNAILRLEGLLHE